MTDQITTTKSASDKLSPAKERAIAALLATRTITEAAESARVGRATLFRWLCSALIGSQIF